MSVIRKKFSLSGYFFTLFVRLTESGLFHPFNRCEVGSDIKLIDPF